MSTATNKSIVKALTDEFIRDTPNGQELLDQAELQFGVASKIHKLRTEAQLTQRQLAEKVGTTASVISRLEDSDYNGHSMVMLQRIAAALGKRVEILFVPAKKSA